MSYKIDKKDPEYVKYTKYIRSKEFEEVKKIVFERDNYTCCMCNWNINEYDPEKKSMKRTLQCHHKTYKHLYDEKNHLEDLVTCCGTCHRACHSAPSNIHRFKKSLEAKLNDESK